MNSREIILNYRESNFKKCWELILKQTERFVWSIVWKIYRHNDKNKIYPNDVNDLYNWGIFGLYDAIVNFDLNIDVKFVTYAGYKISNAIYKEADLRRKSFITVDIDNCFDLAEEEKVPFDYKDLRKYYEEYVIYGEKAINITKIISNIHSMVSNLDETDKKIFELFVFNGYKRKEISESMGLSRGKVDDRINRKISKLLLCISDRLSMKNVQKIFEIESIKMLYESM